MSWRNTSRHVICHDINYVYFDSTFIFTIHNNVKQFLKTSTLMSTIKIILFMIFIFYSYLAIYFNAEVCIIRGNLCHDIKQAMSYHITEFYVTTCHMSRLSQHPYSKWHFIRIQPLIYLTITCSYLLQSVLFEWFPIYPYP